jgi:ABC-type Na+ efflux pump permease subunit
MSTSEALASTQVNGGSEDQPPKADDPVQLDTTAASNSPESQPATTTDTTSAHPQKITFVFGGGRKRKADDDMTAVSSELHTPPSHTTPDPTSAAPVPVAVGEVTSEFNTNNTTTPDAAANTVKPIATPNPPTPASTVEAPKRAPRKRRKWLRKGEVDPEDHQAVAEQKARHALIDAALEALDQQEQAILDETHPQLLELWKEIERRRDIRLAYNKYHEECEMRELEKLRLQELGQIRIQFTVSLMLS